MASKGSITSQATFFYPTDSRHPRQGVVASMVDGKTVQGQVFPTCARGSRSTSLASLTTALSLLKKAVRKPVSVLLVSMDGCRRQRRRCQTASAANIIKVTLLHIFLIIAKDFPIAVLIDPSWTESIRQQLFLFLCSECFLLLPSLLGGEDRRTLLHRQPFYSG